LSKNIIKHHAIAVDTDNVAAIGNAIELESSVSAPRPAPPRSLYESENPGMLGAEFEVEEAKRLARDTIRNANNEAGDILDRARHDTEKMRRDAQNQLSFERDRALEEAKEVGYNQGYSDGHDEGRAIAAATLRDAEEILTRTTREREEALANFEPRIVNLIVGIVENLGLANVRMNPAVVLNLVKRGLSEASFTGDIILRVSKDDFDFVVENKEEIMAHVKGGANLEIVADHSLSQADCLIETPFGVVDSSLNMQLDELKQDLLQILSMQ